MNRIWIVFAVAAALLSIACLLSVPQGSAPAREPGEPAGSGGEAAGGAARGAPTGEGRRAQAAPAANPGLEALLRLAAESDDADLQHDLLEGILQGLAGRRSVAMPEAWPAAYARLGNSDRRQVRDQALKLALLFKDPQAFERLRNRAQDPKAEVTARVEALEALVASRDPQLPPMLLGMLDAPGLRRAALRGLAQYDHPATVERVLRAYPGFDGPQRQDALQTLASRAAWAERLLDAVESAQVPRRDLTAYTIRQIQSLGDRELSRRVSRVWGNVQTTSAEKARQIRSLSRSLQPDDLASADRAAGRRLFQRTCANCHRLFGEGTAVGPDITGAQRSNLQYLLENIVAPNAAVSKDFQMEIVATLGGRVITGLVVSEDEQVVTLRTVNEKIAVPVDEIEQRRQSPLSLMPEGLLNAFSPEEIRNLIAYLSSPSQIPLPPDSQ